MKDCFFKSTSLRCDLWLWQEESWSSRSIYNARFYEKLARKPKGDGNFVFPQLVPTDGSKCVSNQRSHLKKLGMFKRAGVSQGQYPDPDVDIVTDSVSQKRKTCHCYKVKYILAQISCLSESLLLNN